MADPADLPGASSSQKMSSKLLRQRAQEFLASRKHANNLVDIIAQWDVSAISEMNFKHTGYASPPRLCSLLKFLITLYKESTSSCLLTIETIFVEILRRGDMYLERTITLTISGTPNYSKHIPVV